MGEKGRKKKHTTICKMVKSLNFGEGSEDADERKLLLGGRKKSSFLSITVYPHTKEGL